MTANDKLKHLISIPIPDKLPYTCTGGYEVKEKEDLAFHLIIDQILKENDSFFQDDFEEIYPKLEPEDQQKLSIALIEHYNFAEKIDNYKSRWELSRSASIILQFIDAKDDDFLALYLKKHTDYDLNINNYTAILLNLSHRVRTEKLGQNLVTQIERLHSKHEALTKSGNHNDTRTTILVKKILGLYDTSSFLQKNVDSNFATGTLLQYLNTDFPIYDNDPYREEHLKIHDLINQKIEHDAKTISKDIIEFDEVKALLKEDRLIQKNHLMALMYQIVWKHYDAQYNHEDVQFANAFIRKRLPFEEQELMFILTAYIQPEMSRIHMFNMNSFFKNVEAHIKKNGVSDALKETLENIMTAKERAEYDDRDFKRIQTKTKEILSIHTEDFNDKVIPYLFGEDDQIGGFINSEIASLKPEARSKWYELFRFSSTASSGKPSNKKLVKAKELVTALGEKEFLAKVNNWFTHATKMEVTVQNEWYSFFISSNNTPTLKGIAWCLSTTDFSALDEIIEKLIVRCFKKIPGQGPSCGALGNACIYSVASRNSLEAVALLNRVKSRIAQRNTKALIGKYIVSIASSLDISVEELEDFSIPDFDLTNGEKSISFNDYQARISMPVFGKAVVEWIKPDGKLQKSVPSFVRKDFPTELKSIQNEKKLIPKTLTIQRDKLDRSYIQNRILSYPHFSKYYFQHGLMSKLSHKLIWNFEKQKKQTNAMWINEQWQDVNGKAVDWIDEACMVKLWHPLHSATAEILNWRQLLLDQEIKQPLKQAFREVYVLTEAEINTKVYSNRMAAHILKQHQFNALSGLRGWKYELLGAYDDGIDGAICNITIPAYNLSAEYWISEVNADDAFNDVGIWLYVATDQVRFKQNQNLLDLADVPRIVFSEVMRDVDLFVGVASVGNDPQWQDRGEAPQFNTYWENYSFGDLSEVAKTRKTVLENLIPRLKIADVCSIEGKFLIVKGKLRTYKIHIGSTNILMEPNDQYLCIVPDRSAGKAGDKLFIPFEGDRGLSIIISKAFLLADDDKITDKTITQQIK